MKKVAAVIGAAVAGFAAGILTAPKSGKETRRDIKQKADELKVVAKKRAGQAKAAAKESAQSIKAGAHKVGTTAAATAREVRGNVEKNFR